jgi:hypothetical protein
MAADQEARVAEINALLQTRGADELRGPARVALVHELGGLLGAAGEAAVALPPEKQARAEEIGRRLRDHAAGKPDARLDVFERGRLGSELSQILLGDDAGESEGAA